MWFWQRKEVWFGSSMRKFSRLRELLSQNGIRYDSRVGDRLRLDSSGRVNGMGRAWENPAPNTMYYLYVHREDFDRAVSLINGSGGAKI